MKRNHNDPQLSWYDAVTFEQQLAILEKSYSFAERAWYLRSHYQTVKAVRSRSLLDRLIDSWYRIENLVAEYRVRLEQQRAIRQLRDMPDWMLKDIGLNQGTIEPAVRGEYQRPNVALEPQVNDQPSVDQTVVINKAA